MGVSDRGTRSRIRNSVIVVFFLPAFHPCIPPLIHPLILASFLPSYLPYSSYILILFLPFSSFCSSCLSPRYFPSLPHSFLSFPYSSLFSFLSLFHISKFLNPFRPQILFLIPFRNPIIFLSSLSASSFLADPAPGYSSLHSPRYHMRSDVVPGETTHRRQRPDAFRSRTSPETGRRHRRCR